MSGATTDRFDEIFTTSLLNYKKTLADNIFDSYPLFDVMNKEGKDEGEDATSRGGLVFEDNANDIIIDLMYGKNTTVKSYSGYDTIDLTPPVGLGNAKYPMKQVAGSVFIDRFSERQNAGKAQLIKLFDAKMQQLEMSFQDVLSPMLYADGSGNDSKDITGLGALVAVTNTNTVGGISGNTYAFWRNYATTCGSSAVAYDNLLSGLRTMYLNLCLKKQKPNLGLTTLTVYSNLEAKLLATMNYNIGMSNLLSNANYGFDNIKFHNVTCTFDNDCPSGRFYMLNTKFIKFHVDKGTYFYARPFQQPIDQDARVSLVFLYGELCTSNRRMHGVLSSIT